MPIELQRSTTSFGDIPSSLASADTRVFLLTFQDLHTARKIHKPVASALGIYLPDHALVLISSEARNDGRSGGGASGNVGHGETVVATPSVSEM